MSFPLERNDVLGMANDYWELGQDIEVLGSTRCKWAINTGFNSSNHAAVVASATRRILLEVPSRNAEFQVGEGPKSERIMVKSTKGGEYLKEALRRFSGRKEFY
eukprot:Gb_18248 [translate_table: standard]